MNTIKQTLSIMGLLLLTSCSTVFTKSEPQINGELLIAQDFVNTMVQIEQLSPFSTVLQFDSNVLHASGRTTLEKASRSFGQALKDAASGSGYAVQMTRSQQGANAVRFSVSEVADATAGAAYTYDVSIGDVDFRRIYQKAAEGRVHPYQAMMVRGADVSNIQPDDSIFYKPDNALQNRDLIANSSNSEIAKPATTETRSGFDSPVARNDQKRRDALQSESLAVATPVPLAKPLTPEPSVLMSAQNTDNIVPFDGIGKKNIAESGMSNYDSLLASKENVAEEILIFGDDSYVLGARNKKILGDIMTSFNPDTDVVSVVGCSTGSTKIANGNAALAIGRANRVKEALLYSGVPHDKIYDEGCWSPTPNSTPFPNRGVVITVKRGVKNG